MLDRVRRLMNRVLAPVLLAFLDWLDGRLSAGLPQMDREGVVEAFLSERAK